MAVISGDRLWKCPVPYVFHANARELVLEAIPEINAAAGRRILFEVAPKHAPEAHLHISKANAQSESIGFIVQQIKVSAESKRALIHEILHALGFHHEQFHRRFAWHLRDDEMEVASSNPKVYLPKKDWNRFLARKIDEKFLEAEPYKESKGVPQPYKESKGLQPSFKAAFSGKIPKSPKLVTASSASKIPKSPKFGKSSSSVGMPSSSPKFKHTISGGGKPHDQSLPPEPKTAEKAAFLKKPVAKQHQKAAKKMMLGAEQQFRSYLECISNQNIIRTEYCDYDSIMMYDELAGAALETYNKFGMLVPQPVKKRTLMGDNRGLSPEDAEAIRQYIVPAMF
jgi:hypothetical protein